MDSNFNESYEKLNSRQKEAVDMIDGPVMVVAGPGTGKTQILSLRIGNILKETDTNPDSILCLTFTNSGVRAMKNRLESYIGSRANDVKISTFHSFAISLIEENYELLGFESTPSLLGDDEAVFLVDELLQSNDWKYLRPRSNPAMYFNDLKGLISLLKRERISDTEFLNEIEKEIEYLENDPGSISTRGSSKGEIKKAIQAKIDSLSRTKEVVMFYRLYENKKRENLFMDYDDVLEYAVKLVEEFEDVRDELRENYLYILVDEHQDSSGVQNSFLKAVWKEVDKPNIFVVGDDRQLIYAFSGASLSYFKEFETFFGKAQLIVLTENYRSTKPILELADDLLKSSITQEKLVSNKKGDTKVILSEYEYPREEIIGAGIYFKQKIEEGILAEECALLVPKNYEVREAVRVLLDLGLPVSAEKSISLFSVPETEMMRRILSIITNPFDSRLISESMIDPTSGIEPIRAHEFLKKHNNDKLEISHLTKSLEDNNLFSGEDNIFKWGQKLKRWVNDLSKERLEVIISSLGNELLIDESSNNDELLNRVEVVRSFINLASLFSRKNKNAKLKDFLTYLDRLETYNTHIELARFGVNKGIKVMTLHKSKGLEYECVWVAHLNEETLMSKKNSSFGLPEKIKEHLSERNVAAVKRELYVAVTRAKEFCVLSFASLDYNGRELNLANIIKDLDQKHFVKKNKEDNETKIISFDIKTFAGRKIVNKKTPLIEEFKKLVRENYSDIKVSVTLLNNFFECSWKWYFRNFLKLPEVKTNSLILGNVVHSTIEYILKSKEKISDNEIKNKIILFFDNAGVDDSVERKKMEKDSFEAVKLWKEKYLPSLEKSFKSERSLSLKDSNFPDLLIHGKIDLTEFKGENEVWVTDFKTGKSKTKNYIEKRDEEGRMSSLMRQLAMYSYLVAGEDKKNRVSKSRLLFLEAEDNDKNALYETEITNEEIDLLKRDIEDYEKYILSGDWINMTCKANNFGGNSHECEYCRRAEFLLSKDN